MCSILKTISLIAFLSLVFIFNESKHRLKQIMIFTNISFISVESQPQPHELEYWIPQYTDYLIYGINDIHYCGLLDKPIEYTIDRNDHNYCKVDKNATPIRRIDPGNYKRYHPYRRPKDPNDQGPYNSKGTKGRIYPPLEVAQGESPYTLLFKAKIPENKLQELLDELGIQANSRSYKQPRVRTLNNETNCVTIQENRTVFIENECTASLIAPQWILLAAHCRPYVLPNQFID